MFYKKNIAAIHAKTSSSQRRELSITYLTIKYLSIAIQTTLVFILAVNPAWAVQAHGGSEGLVAHQIGHLLFIIGMIYLLFRLYTNRQKKTGWFEFKAFLWLLIVWNIVTFSGHWMNEFIDNEKFIKAGARTLAFSVESNLDAFYYLTRLDHLILVPAFTLLLLALKKWRKTQ